MQSQCGVWRKAPFCNVATQRHLLTSTVCSFASFTPQDFPTFVIVQLVPVPVHHVHLQKVEESARDEEAVREGKAFDVTHVQGEGVGGRWNGAQGHQLADDVPHTNT